MSESSVVLPWGYFGKIPTKGDFIKDGLPLDFVNSWQDWQQAVLAVSREQLEEDWTTLYMNAPIWHFSFAPKVCGERAMIGTMIPSVDSVGRYFFFTVARSVEGDALSYWLNRSWSELTQGLALKVLDDNYQHEKWINDLKANLQEDTFCYPAIGPITPILQATQNLVYEEHVQIEGSALLNKLLQAQQPRACFWWTEGTESISPVSAVTDGLPAVGQFSAMLDGCWDKWNW
ncbi:type VI secretion system-associated protein TagF [Vibrio tapetis subsp. quintayensis]|uniref:type VI secretion system-associated protein TagF n=1 Tax=Vibrio tapetis TaxID=52443 RepID=UPI0025B30666|nr:type VI secretion system-associated protein TagF [Vibrio tapetis]MDN3681077.1 type VI secretion system-associated protein TagF [Vibrio tapetis subsp. quintayensis]